jgi:hypothetical protein
MSDVNEFNVETDQSLIRVYNEEELAQREIDLLNIPEVDSVSLPVNAQLISAVNKLKALGLTESEAKAVIGI